MAVTYINFLNAASILINGTEEIDFRNAASRAYYACYHECERISQYSTGVANLTVGTHAQLIKKLKTHQGNNAQANNIRQVGNLLSQGKKIRARADYQINNSFTKKQAISAIYTANQIISLTKAMP